MLHRLTSLRLHPVQLGWIAALFFASIGNPALWKTLATTIEIHDPRSFFFFLSVPVFLFFAFNLLLAPILILPYLRKPLLALLIIISASCSYFMLHYNVLIDRSMVQNFFETNQVELASYFSMSLLLTIIGLGILPAAMIGLCRTRDASVPRTALWWSGNIVLSAIVLATISLGFYKDYASLFRNNRHIRDLVLPLNVVRHAHGYLTSHHDAKRQPLQRVGEDAIRAPRSAAARPKLVIFVVGETARAKNFQLNGYSRPTNPSLSRYPDIISFRNVASCGTATAISVPCMFSRMGRADYDGARASSEENLLDILQRTGIQILWRNNNNGGCKGVCERIVTEDMPRMKIAGDCPNKDGTCHDSVLLHGLRTRIDAMQGDALVVLHQLGSHGPTYFERYPQHNRVFTPTCDSNQIHRCSKEELVNTYDNTLLQTDEMLGRTLALLQHYSGERDVALVYVSDHGESLGERGMYLHGTPYAIAPREQTHVPMIMWFSPQFLQNAALDHACVRDSAWRNAYSHDNVYHSMLGLFDVRSRVYQPALDAFSPCRT